MQVSALWIYPLKGARGVPVPSAEVTRRGFEGDRRWMIVGEDGHFLSARTHPAMLGLAAELLPGGLRITTPGGTRHEVSQPEAAAPLRRCIVWNSVLDLPEATSMRDQVTDMVGIRAALVYQSDDVHRATNAEYAPGHEVSLADGYPVLLAHEASRQQVEREAGRAVDVRRFRPNVVVRGAAEAWAEDRWHRLRVGEVAFRNVKPCARCEVPSFDPDTLERSREPLRTLARLRKQGSKVLFGANLVPLDGGVVRVGDPLVIES